MNRAEKRRQRKLAQKAAKTGKPAPAASLYPNQQTLFIEQSIDKALQHHTAGRLSEAEAIYQQILQADPKQPDALHLLGVLAHQAGKHDIAVDLITKSLAENPYFPDAHNNLGNVYKDMGRLDEAVTSYQKGLKIKPDYFEAHNNLGIVLRDLGRPDEAVASYRKALAIKSDFAEAHNNLGNALHDLGKLDEAVESHQKALVLNPQYAEAHNNLANAFKDLGRLDKQPEHLEKAVESYHKALAIKPDLAGAYNNLGNVLKDQGRLDEAVSCLQKAIDINPHYHSARHLLNSLIGETTASAPREFVEDAFNSYAENFDHHLVNDLAYTMPSLLKDALLELDIQEGKFKNVMDMGCGTGLSGAAFRDIAETLIGIDLSRNMVRKAEEKNIYDELYVDDIIERLEGLGTDFDLYISSDVFIYVGDLLPIFESIKKHAAKNALLVFSTEHFDGNGFVLNNKCRYAHSKEYVLSIAERLGFQLEYYARSNLRKESDDWIVGDIYILKCG